jgi:hypothetical protein
MNNAIEDAVAALQLFGDDLDRPTASAMLGMWVRRSELTEADRVAVLDVFPAVDPPAVPDGVDGFPIAGRDDSAGWLSGSMGTERPPVRHGAVPIGDTPRYDPVKLLWQVLDLLQRAGVEVRVTPYHLIRKPVKASKKLLYELGVVPAYKS